MVAEKQLTKLVQNQPIKYSCALPTSGRGEIVEALLSEDEHQFADRYEKIQFVAAATAISSDPAGTAWRDPLAVYQNLDSFAKAFTCRVAGFREAQ